jgi:type IV pilus assembly protein PilQ
MMKMLHSTKYYISCCFITFLLFIPHFIGNAHAAEAYQVTDIEWAENNNEFWVAIVGETPPVYTVYELLDPLRVVIDLANASLTFPINMNLAADDLPITNIKGSELKNQEPTIARVELILTADRSYTVEREGNDVIVVFRDKPGVLAAGKKASVPKPVMPSPVAAPAPPVPTPVFPASISSPYLIGDIEWTKTDKEFWVAIRGDTPPAYTVNKLSDPLRVVIDIANASLTVPISMDLADEGVLVREITATEHKDKDPAYTTIEMLLAKDRHYTIERENNDILVVFTDKPPLPAVAKKTFAPPPISALSNATVIFDVKVETTPGETRINVRADGPIKNFQKAELSKTSGKPNRMYVDIPNIRMPRLTNKKNISSMLAGIRMARRGSGVRIAFDSALDSLFPYSMMTSPEGLLVSIGEGAFAEPAPTYTKPSVPIVEAAEAAVPPPLYVQPVIPEPAPEITETVPEPKTVAKGKQLPLITEMIQPVIPATPTVQLEKNQPETASIQPSVPEKEIAKETEKTKKKPGITDEFGFSGYESQRITIDFFKVDLHNVFRLFGEISNRNIVIAEGVSGSLTLALKDVPWDFALDIILNLKDLQKEEQFHTLVISPKSKNFTWPERASKTIAFKADESISMDASEPISIKKRDDTSMATVEAQKFIRQAQLHEKKGDYKGALALYEKSYNIWPQNAQLAKRIASLALVNLKMYAKGTHYAEMALKSNPSDYDAALLAAIGFANMKKVSNAKLYFDQAISSPRPSGEALINYATFCEEFQSYGAALQLYNKHEEIYGYTLDVMIGKARVLDKKGKTAEALGEYKAILHSGFDLPKDLKQYIQGRLAMAK